MTSPKAKQPSPHKWPDSIFIQKDSGNIVFGHLDYLYAGDHEDAIATAKSAGYKRHPTCDEVWVREPGLKKGANHEA